MATPSERFEARWQLAHQVRAMERQRGNSQPPSRRGSGELSAAAAKPSPPGTDVPGQAAAALLAANPGQQALSADNAPRVIRQQEVEDDDMDAAFDVGAGEAPASCASDRENAAPSSIEQEDQEQRADGSKAAAATKPAEAYAPEAEAWTAAEEDEAEPQHEVVWDSSCRQVGTGCKPQLSDAAAGSLAAELKEQGNALVRQGNYQGAAEAYAQAITACKQEKEGARDEQLLATLHSNRAHALIQANRFTEALADAQAAHRLLPAWPKPLHRMAEAHLALGQYAAAAGACKLGERLSPANSEGHTDFTPLLDRVAVAAAAAGSLVGYDGMQLEVRDAGEEAWLGRPAPHVPELDGPQDEDNLLPTTMLPALPSGPGTAGGSGKLHGDGARLALAEVLGGSVGRAAGDALASWDYRQTVGMLQRRRTSFRSVKEAVAAARDGDRILLRRGVHNGMGECIDVKRRVLIEGEGQPGEAVIDQRANVPTFRIQRGGVVVRNLLLDQTGFREALLVTGGASVQPLIENCTVKCSGDDALNIGGSARPTLRGCTLTAKKCGVRTYEAAAGRLEHCVIEKCGEQGLKAMDSSCPTLWRCHVQECEEEGAVVMDSARLSLLHCQIGKCKGPGVDCSGSAALALSGGSVADNVGGVWLWDSSKAELTAVALSGGPSHAILTDGQGIPTVRDCTVRGTVHATDAAWAGILHPSNTMADPEQPTDLPPEAGPFRFAPNRFLRKQ